MNSKRHYNVYDSFQDCAAIRDKMSGSTPHEDKPLNTVILPSYTVAHQYFAIQLLEWLVKLFGKCSGFRALFAEVAFSVRNIEIVKLSFGVVVYFRLNKLTVC